MASVVSICNSAYGNIGTDARISSINEDTVLARRAALFYPQARDYVLSAYPWSFAIKRAALADLSAAYDVPTSWGNVYAKPADALTLLSIGPDEPFTDRDVTDFKVETADGVEVIYATMDDAKVRYVSNDVDPAKFPPLVVMAIQWMLSYHLAGPTIKGDAGMKIGVAALQQAEYFIGKASAHNANQRHDSALRRDSATATPWIAAR